MKGEIAQEILDRLTSMKKRRQGDRNKEDIEFILNELSNMLRKFVERDKKRDLGFKYDDGTFNPVEDIGKLYGIMATSKSKYQQLEYDLDFLNRQYNDLTHALELLNEDDVSMLEMAKQLKQNRVHRREVKKLLELGKPMQDLLNNYPNFMKDASHINQTVKKIQQTQLDRSYCPREATALEEAFAKAREKELAARK